MKVARPILIVDGTLRRVYLPCSTNSELVGNPGRGTGGLLQGGLIVGDWFGLVRF